MFREFKRHFLLGLPRDAYFTWGIVVSIFQGLSAVALLAASSWLISRAAEVTSIVFVGIAIVGVRGFAIGRATFRYLERLLLHESSFRLLAFRRKQMFERLAPLIPSGLAQLGRGETMARVVNDVEQLQNLPLRVIAPLVQSIVTSVASAAFIWLLLPEAGIALVCVLIAAFCVAMPLSAKLSKTSDLSIAPLTARMSNLSLDLLENLDVYIAYGWVETKRAEIATLDSQLKKALVKSALSNGVGASIMTLLSTAAVVSGAWLGGSAVTSETLPGASLAVFALFPLAIFEIIQMAQPALSAYRKYRVSAQRVAQLIDYEIPSSLRFEPGECELEEFRSLALQSVAVTYPSNQEPSLENFNLAISQGESIMLFGESGAGKSSVALILARLIQPTSGQFLLNGKPASCFTPDSVRRIIGLVEQEPMIFLGDVRANLAFAKPRASDDELEAVLHQVGLWQMFADRQGLSTELGDRGVLISGGESQRLALARAILADFELLILDEPTANVDSATAESLVKDLLRIAHGSGNRTVILISHDERFERLVNRTVVVAKR